MRDTDIEVRAARVDFRTVRLAHPLSISGRLIDGFTVAEVGVRVRSRSGQVADGSGASVLSVPWAWPGESADVAARDVVLRRLTEEIAQGAVGSGPADPVALWREQHAHLPVHLGGQAEEAGPIPALAGSLALGALDNALHDAWSRAAGRPAWSMYDESFLSSDLGWLTSTLRGAYPGSFGFDDRRRLPVQHVVGVTDPLDGADGLAGWLDHEQVRHLKIKLTGADPSADARRVADVHELATRHVGRPELAIDPNEGYADGDVAREMLTELAGRWPAARSAVTYLEQPVPRGHDGGQRQMRALAQEVPTLLDEGFTDLSALHDLADRGWSGVVVKAGKGQTPTLLAHAWARATGGWITVQDLTTVGLAFLHSARLVGTLRLSSSHLEYNSRQYAPDGQAELARRHPALTTVRAGAVTVPGITDTGLYGVPDVPGEGRQVPGDLGT
ncbi:mandelate racemase/muconate lactonizing enzyme family protein [Georgenia halophila]|uniref:Mandelate racemase/muconate lactonizing enzyme family protein n=1 Tax=Georgenia halophila TaxID=620889 RepID=A0ABP8LJ21_9MICO